jgi:hypothetical protein
MKNIISKISVLLLLVLILGCSSENPIVPCVPVTCKNGGTSTPNCGCTCPQGYTGSDCSFQVTPSKIVISKITVTAFPNLNSNGFNWDVTLPTSVNALPDIYVKIKNSVGSDFYESSTYFKNAMADGTKPYEFIPTAPLEVTNANSIFTFQLYDYDSADSNVNDGIDDLMATKVFSIYSSTGGFPTTITITDSNIPVSFTLTLSYTW